MVEYRALRKKQRPLEDLHTDAPLVTVARMIAAVDSAMAIEGIDKDLRERIRNRLVTGAPQRPTTMRRAPLKW